MLADKASEIISRLKKDDEFSSILITIAYTLIIMVNSIRLYKLCHEDEYSMYKGLKHIGPLEKIVLNRQIAKVKELKITKDERKELANIIVEVAGELTKEEFDTILAEVKELS